MKKTLLYIALAISIPALACAKKPKTPKPQAEQQTVVEEEPEPELTEECLRNISIVHENVKNKQFEDAYEQWMQVYTTCPQANKSIYTDGAKIVEYLYNKTTDPAEKERLANLAVQMCDKRIKYMGNDPKYPRAYILGEKGLAYCQFFENDEVKEPAYEWLKESVNELQTKSKLDVLFELVKVSYNLYRSNPDKYGEQFIADYTQVGGFLQHLATDPAYKNASAAAQRKDAIDQLFAASGAADCTKLDELYASFVKENSGVLEILIKVINLYKRVNCNESEVYFAASEAAHKLEPTEESAVGCARMCMKKEDWHGAISYYNEALNLIDEDDDDKSDYLYNIAYIYHTLKSYSDARTYARRSLEANPNQGRCYMLIGFCYAAAKPYSTDNYGAKAGILNKTVFWAAVDQFAKAKQVEPEIAETANKYIAEYSRYFPTKEEMFDLPNEFGGGSFIVGGWINERTVCRAAK